MYILLFDMMKLKIYLMSLMDVGINYYVGKYIYIYNIVNGVYELRDVR